MKSLLLHREDGWAAVMKICRAAAGWAQPPALHLVKFQVSLNDEHHSIAHDTVCHTLVQGQHQGCTMWHIPQIFPGVDDDLQAKLP